MRTILDFIYNFRAFFVFLFLEFVSLFLVVSYNDFQRTVFLSSSNVIVGNIYTYRNNITSYFGLISKNKSLAKENSDLKDRLYYLENQVAFYKQDTSYKGRKDIAVEKKYKFITAKVIYASTSKIKNFITIDKGSADSIKPNMGVINCEGVIGIVSTVSEHFSVILPIINSDSRISAKIKGKSQTGSLVWEGGDEQTALLREVPRHVYASKGDTVVTSGYSSIFPEGINIGIISTIEKDNDNFHYIEVGLSPKFDNLSYVDVIEYKNSKEQKDLETKRLKEDDK